MEKMRVLIADDSVVVRRVVTEELGAQPDIEVVGSASNGRSALEKRAQLSPDLIILDIEMPEMDGLTALPLMRKSHPHVPVVMFSSRTIDGAAATIEALARGAADFFAKPQSLGGLEASRQIIRNELIPALRALHGQRQRLQSRISSAGKPTNSVTATSPNSRAPLATSRKISDTWTPSGSGLGTASRSESVQRVDLVVIAASTGGPNALVEIFGGLPAQFPVPLLIVQHMPPMFTQMLAERLTKTSKIPTTEAKSGAQLEPGRAWIAPGDYHMVVGREAGRWQLNVNQEPPENACRPAADPLLRSISRSHGKHTLAVILTGMGQDGLRGCESLRSVGGQIIVQDEGSSVVWGMPGYVAKAGLADRVIPLPLIATEIVRRVRHERG